MRIIALIAALICLELDYYEVGFWIGFAVVLHIAIYRSMPGFYREIITDYPRESCVEPKICKWMFPYNHSHPDKGLPKEIYVQGIAVYIGYLVYSVLLFVILPFNEVISSYLAVCYLFYFVIVMWICVHRGTMKSFYARYKIMNRYNFFRTALLANKTPYPQLKGKCEILSERRKRKKIFVMVRMLEDGEVIEDVLLSGCKKEGKNQTYHMYEICKVKYII